MNRLSNQTAQQASERSQVALSFLASETTFLSSSNESLAIRELELEAEMKRRAGVMTDVLAKIMEEPAPFRHWGLNE